MAQAATFYAKSERPERRMLNRALFRKITIDDDEQVTAEPVQTIAAILATNTSPHNLRTLPHDDAGQGSNVSDYVELKETRNRDLITAGSGFV
ncbi:hypothetical protein MUN77_03965 [Leucobacter allii]|uniref:hypothetical protein n=1 Tax=Leucobacter allii TaxID=2932247 RepID=UPI001FD25875|nr:hypothetical protein [Leucobacter allii]UOR02471.1 hypothetical protein MUN77_03965 [Leucobacter allii]